MGNYTNTDQIALLGSALAIGLLIGMERGWKSRDAKEGTRVAGLRTYGLIGLLGGGTGILSEALGAVVFALTFSAFAIAATIVYVRQPRISIDTSITGLIAMLVTYVLGALATLDYLYLAAPAAVVTAILLNLKDTLHGWLRKLEKQEMYAILKLLLISIVLLPILPDQGYGPWQSLNPYHIWWMVVLIAAISFGGYFATKIIGASKGLIFTALAAGLASSTALTLHYSKLARTQTAMRDLLVAGILIACGTMFPRMLLVASLVNIKLLGSLVIPVIIMTSITFLSAGLYWRKSVKKPAEKLSDLRNPMELKSALVFGLILAAVMLLGKASAHYFGETGLYTLALLSGIADVDPINLTLSKMSLHDITLQTATFGIIIAASSNTLIKSMMAVIIAGKNTGIKVLIPLLLSTGCGIGSAWLI